MSDKYLNKLISVLNINNIYKSYTYKIGADSVTSPPGFPHEKSARPDERAPDGFRRIRELRRSPEP